LNPGLGGDSGMGGTRMATARDNPVAWENFYNTARWRRLRKFQLIQHPLCKFCLERGS